MLLLCYENRGRFRSPEWKCIQLQLLTNHILELELDLWVNLLRSAIRNTEHLMDSTFTEVVTCRTTVPHEHLKDRGLFSLPPPPPGANPAEYYHQMTLMATHRSPYGDILMQTGGTGSTTHITDYINPVD
eukprot:g34069.t1